MKLSQSKLATHTHKENNYARAPETGLASFCQLAETCFFSTENPAPTKIHFASNNATYLPNMKY